MLNRKRYQGNNGDSPESHILGTPASAAYSGSVMESLSDYDYELPEELIAAEPLPERDQSRLLVVDRAAQGWHHRGIRDLPEFLRPGDCLVLNDTQVIPARLLGERTATGGKWEGLFLGTTTAGQWRLIGQSRGALRPGETVTVRPAHHPESSETLVLTLLDREADGVWHARPNREEGALELLARFGTVPLPPYIRRKLASAQDWQRYQTTYSRHPGAVAAPTAGLHFTPELLDACRARGVETAFVTLHVGIGTFRPIAVERLSDHHMHAEWCAVPPETADRVNATRAAGGRIIAVGTTTVRTLESLGRDGTLRAGQGETDLFIRPPYAFRMVDGLLTNFHLPRSTLLVLVSALAGRELIRRAYAAAIAERYRFFSYGDAMPIL